jgi:hypothetical protein
VYQKSTYHIKHPADVVGKKGGDHDCEKIHSLWSDGERDQNGPNQSNKLKLFITHTDQLHPKQDM